ncbi:MAG: hypothetical protein JO087_18545, partial [Actinobacteria bacterium]|nr:hypothetical protein [Actinomycetota bacterium]
FRVGRWVSADGGIASFALPNEPHRKMSDEVRGDVEETVSAHFGVRVPIKLVVDQGEHETAEASATPPPASATTTGRALGAVRKAQKASAAAPAQSTASAPASTPAPAPEAPAPAKGGAFPTRDDLTAAWADEILPKLSQRARARFRVGRWVSADGGIASFALPNEPHRKMSDEVRGDVEETVSAHFGVRVPIKLVVDQGEHETAEATATAPPQGPDEPVDLGELEDAPAVTSPEDRLKEAFPGAEEVTVSE